MFIWHNINRQSHHEETASHDRIGVLTELAFSPEDEEEERAARRQHVQKFINSSIHRFIDRV